MYYALLRHYKPQAGSQLDMIRRQKGFSLVELMVVVAIIAVMALASTPNIVTGLPKYRVKNAARDLASKMRKARSIAVKKHRDVNVVFDTDNNRYSIDGVWFPGPVQNLSGYYGSSVAFGASSATTNATDGGGTLPDDYVSFTGNSVRFNAQGISNKMGYVYFTNSRGNDYAVGVRNLAGAITVRRWTGGSWYP